jgi:histidinol-phosphate phosphatase family protein
MKRAAVFIDKDGTLVHDVPYNVDPARIRLTPGAGEGLRLLRASGYVAVVITNQPGIAQRRFRDSALRAVRAHIDRLLQPYAVALEGFYYCPHAADAMPACACRKPAPGLLVRAAAELDLDLDRSWMVGDILNDVEAGRRAGCRTVLIDCGNETQWELTPWRAPDVVAPDLRAAARFIVNFAPRAAVLEPAR